MRKKKVKAVLYLYMGLFAEMGLRGIPEYRVN
jgi:hypothetical protein